jgi:MFS family permease
MPYSIDTPAQTSRRSAYLVVVLALAYMLSYMDRQILGLLVGPIRQDLGITDVEISLLQGLSFALLYGLGSLPAGRLADGHNRTILIAVGVCFWSVMTAACGLARNFGSLFIARAGVGIGESVLSPAAYSMLADTYPPRDLPRAMAGFTVGGILGAGLGFVVGGVVVGVVSHGTMVALPILGEIKPWQAAFIIIGLPGILVSFIVLTVREPRRRNLLHSTDGVVSKVSTKEVLLHVAKRWRGYVPLTLGAAALSVLGYGYLGWFPTYLIRVHGVSAGSAGVQIGIIYLIFGPLGAYGGARFAMYLRERGYADANLRAVMLIALAFIPLSCGTLAANSTVALIAAAPLAMLLASYLGIAATALQLVTPNQMRALVSALFQLAINLLGLTLGPTIVAVLTQRVFADDKALDMSLMITVGGAAVVASGFLSLALPHYRLMLVDADAWSGDTSVRR